MKWVSIGYATNILYDCPFVSNKRSAAARYKTNSAYLVITCSTQEQPIIFNLNQGNDKN